MKTQKDTRPHDEYQVPGTWYAILSLLPSRGFTPIIQMPVSFVCNKVIRTIATKTCCADGRASREGIYQYSMPQYGHHAMCVLFWFDMMQQYIGDDAAATSYHAWYYRNRW